MGNTNARQTHIPSTRSIAESVDPPEIRVAVFFLRTLIGTCRTENRPRTAGLAENQTSRGFFASGRQAPAGRILIGLVYCFLLIVSGSRKMSAQRPRIRSQHENATFFAPPPPFHSLRKPFCVRRKRPPALLSEIWLDLA